MYDFQYHRPTTIDEAVALLEGAEDGQLLAGGLTLIPTLKQRLAQPSDVIDLGRVEGMRGISALGGTIEIGAMMRHGEVAASADVQRAIPSLARLAGIIGDPHVRNQGTIGGSLANNDPTADYPAAVLALNATVHTNQREITANDFFVDLFETALNDGEIITRVSFPLPERAGYAKFPNPASRYAIVGVMAADLGSAVRVAVTGAGPCVFRVRDMEAALLKSFKPEAVANISIPDDGLNSDIHASADYRAHLVAVMAKRAVAAAD